MKKIKDSILVNNISLTAFCNRSILSTCFCIGLSLCSSYLLKLSSDTSVEAAVEASEKTSTSRLGLPAGAAFRFSRSVKGWAELWERKSKTC